MVSGLFLYVIVKLLLHRQRQRRWREQTTFELYWLVRQLNNGGSGNHCSTTTTAAQDQSNTKAGCILSNQANSFFLFVLFERQKNLKNFILKIVFSYIKKVHVSWKWRIEWTFWMTIYRKGIKTSKLSRPMDTWICLVVVVVTWKRREGGGWWMTRPHLLSTWDHRCGGKSFAANGCMNSFAIRSSVSCHPGEWIEPSDPVTITSNTHIFGWSIILVDRPSILEIFAHFSDGIAIGWLHLHQPTEHSHCSRCELTKESRRSCGLPLLPINEFIEQWIRYVRLVPGKFGGEEDNDHDGQLPNIAARFDVISFHQHRLPHFGWTRG